MDLNRLIQMIITRFAMRFVNRGIRAGIDRAMPSPRPNRKDMTPEERAQAKAAREMQKRAKQAMRVTRRF